MDFLFCCLYVAAIGIVSNPIAALLPRAWFHPDKFPFGSFRWERNGEIYEKLQIRRWKNRLPDMSKILKHMLRKEISSKPTAQGIEALARETCVSEAVHWVLMVLSLWVLRIWRGAGGWIVYGLCVLGNLPFVLIQRYNRPRLLLVQSRLRKQSNG